MNPRLPVSETGGNIQASLLLLKSFAAVGGMVGKSGFEPPPTRFQSACSTVKLLPEKSGLTLDTLGSLAMMEIPF